MGDGGKGFVYRFPDRDFEIGFARHVPDVGETVEARGRTWKVARVTNDHEQRAIVNLKAVDAETDIERSAS